MPEAKRDAVKTPASNKAEGSENGSPRLLVPWNAMVRGVLDLVAVVAPSPPVADPNQMKAQEEVILKRLELLYSTQFRRLYNSELHFLRLVCKPTRQQFEKIRSDKALEGAIFKSLAIMTHEFHRGRPGDANQANPKDLRKIIVDQFARSLRPTLSSEQIARYQRELDRRNATKKRVVLQGLVVWADNLLRLTADEQRAHLRHVLEKNWRGSWNETTRSLMYGNACYFPRMPDDEILPILTEAQKKVWLNFPKGRITCGFDWGFIREEVDEEVWDEPPPAQNRQLKKTDTAVKQRKTNSGKPQ